MQNFAPPVVDRKVRFALVGCGRIAANHFGALEQHRDRADLVAVCDTDHAALSQAVERTGAEGFDQIDRMLAKADADIVVLTTPSGLHAEQAIAVAATGRHVMTEKPMATRWADGKRMVAACDAAGRNRFRCAESSRD